jgi:membrane protein
MNLHTDPRSSGQQEQRMISKLIEIKKFLTEDLWSVDTYSLSKARQRLVQSVRVLALVGQGAKEDHCPLHASALTYSTLMSMVPFLVILFSIANALGFKKLRDWVETSTAEMPAQFQTFVETLLNTVENINLAALGGISGVLFLVIIFKLLSRIEESFNEIWGVRTSRAISDKLRNYLSVLVLAPALMLVASTASVTVTTFLGKFLPGFWVKGLLQLASAGIMALAFVVLFMFLPNTRVTFKAALTGGLTSAIAVILLQIAVTELGGLIFDKYAIYGSFAAIPVFLFWLHINWQILLFGAEFAFAVQNVKTYKHEQEASTASPQARLTLAFTLLKRICDEFSSGKNPFNIEDYAQQNHIPVRLIKKVTRLLTDAGLITESGEHPGAYTLLKDPDRIDALTVYNLLAEEGAGAEELGLRQPPESVQKLLDQLHAGLEQSLGTQTAKSL